jgi:CubicO group peptidase (beta-lactamase class C family)
MRPFVKAALVMALGVGWLLPAADGLAQDAPPPSSAPAATQAATAQASAATPSPPHARRRPRPSPTIAAPIPAAVPAASPRPGARLAPGTPIPPAELEAFVDGVVRDAMRADHIAGASVSIVQNGQLALKKGYGFARLNPAQPVDPDRTLFRLGPVSHVFTWMVVMKEVEAGHIRPGTPVNLYLPEKLQVKDQGFKRPIYIADLMSHATGFENRVLGHLFEDDPDRVRPLAVYLRQERPRRVREAGTLSSPSDYDTALGGEAASYVVNKPFEQLVETEITGPLGLAHTTFREPYPHRDDLPAPMPAGLAADVSQGFHWADGVFQPRRFEYASQISPAEAASSTASDMARCMLLILGGGQLDGTTVYAPATAAGFRNPPRAGDPAVNGWADGFRTLRLPGDFDSQGQGGATLSFASNLVIVPELGLGVFVAVNTESGARLAASLPAAIVARFYAPQITTPLAGQAALADRAGAYVGDYLPTRRSFGGLEKFVDQLSGWIHVRTTDDGLLVVSGPQIRSRAYGALAEPDRFREVDGVGVLSFQMNDGRAWRVLASAGEGAFERAGLLDRVSVLAWLAALTVIASLTTLIALFTRDRRDFRQTSTQRRADLLQTTIAVLWLTAAATFGLWTRGANDAAKLMYGWPGPALMLSSACALVAAILTLICIVIGPAVWRGGRRVDSWTGGRKLAYTLSTTIFTAFSVVLFLWGALQPWSG